MGRALEYFTFQNKATTNSNGNELLTEKSNDMFVFDSDILSIEISGTATSGTTLFEAKVTPDGDFYSVSAVAAHDYNFSTNTNGINEIWLMDISTFYAFRTRVSGISGGYITIKGRVSK